MSTLVVELDDFQLLAGPNSRAHHMVKAARVKKERQTAHWLLLNPKRPQLPVNVHMVRIGPRRIDEEDNLPGMFKAMRDGVADAYGIADNDKIKMRFTYGQERGAPRKYGVRIEVSPA